MSEREPPEFRFSPMRELRALAEMAGGYSTLPALIAAAPRGDGHPVMTLPGFLSGDGSTRALRRLLVALNYRTVRWKLGRNRGFTDEVFDQLAERIVKHARRRGRVSLVGHSLGGIYARLLAHELPESIRSVILLGAAFNIDTSQRGDSAINELYDRINPIDQMSPRLNPTDLRRPTSMPSTSIYSESDGIVPWYGCREAANANTENIRIPGSHIGMPYNPAVLYVIADRLAQPESGWQPFELRGARRFLYGLS